MSRLFDDAQSEFLQKNAAPITAYPFAMACFFKSDTAAIIQTLIWCGDTTETSYFAALYARGDLVGDPVQAFSHNYGGALTRSANTSSGYTANTWHHGAGIWLGVSEAHAYIDGGSKGSDTAETGAMAGHDAVAIGASRDFTPDAYMSGDIAEAGIWDLTNWGANDAERETNFEKVIASLAKGFSPLLFPLGLVAYWPLIRGLNSKIGDFNLTASGTIVSPHPRIIVPSNYYFTRSPIQEFIRTIDDSVGLDDIESFIKGMNRTFDESIGIDDVSSKIWNSIKIIAESLGIVDVLSKGETRAILETLGITDSISQVSVILRILSDNLDISDIILKGEGKIISDSLGVTDSVSKVSAILRLLSENLNITDEVLKIFEVLRVVSDGASLTDVVSKIHISLRELSDNLGITDATVDIFGVSRIISDSEGITDGIVLQRMMVVADTLGITDDVARLIDYLRVEDDGVGVFDSMARVIVALRTINNDMGISDEMSERFGILIKAVWAFILMRQTHS